MASYNENTANNKPLLEKIKGMVFHREKNLRIVILGSHAVGKTALMIRCLTNKFYNNYVPENEQAYRYTLTVGQKKINFDIIDSKGKNSALICHADAVLLVFSITDFKSFEHVKELIEKVRNLNFNDIPIVIIGNKTDKSKHRAVSKGECEKLSQEKDLKIFELSAAIPTTNMDIVFTEVYKQVQSKKRSRTDSDPNSVVLQRRMMSMTDVKRRLSTSLDSCEFIKVIQSKSMTT